MRIFLTFFLCFCVVGRVLAADLTQSLQNTYRACVGIDDSLADMKKMAGINTVVTGVGTVAGGGALVAGIKKQQVMFGKLRDIEDKYADVEDNVRGDGSKISITQQQGFVPNVKHDKGKKLGNWRTGLLAANTATNVAGAVIAGTNKVDDDLQTQIDKCKLSVKELRNAIAQARTEGVDVSEANKIASACGQYEYVDVSLINKRGKGAQISSVIGGGAGLAGVITSATANKSDGDKEKKLDTTSNVLAGSATALSGAATVFNAMQISAIKKVADVAQNCENLLK